VVRLGGVSPRPNLPEEIAKRHLELHENLTREFGIEQTCISYIDSAIDSTNLEDFETQIDQTPFTTNEHVKSQIRLLKTLFQAA
jgi:hypothetical protein